MEYLEYIFVAITWGIAGFINGLSGMGAAMFAVPTLSLTLDMQTNITLSCLMSPIISILMSWNMRKQCEKQYILPILIGAFPGTAIGAYILKVIPTLYLQIIMSVMLLSYVTWNLTHKNKGTVGKENTALLCFAGFMSGVTGSSLSFFAPPLAIYVLFTGWSPQRTLATLSVAYFIMSVMTCFFQALAGLYTPIVLNYALIASPTVIIGTILSFPVIKYITPKVFKVILLIIIGASGLIAGLNALSTLEII